MKWEIPFYRTLDTLITVNITLICIAYFNFVHDYVHSFLSIMSSYGNGHFQLDNTTCYRARSVSN